MTEPRTNDTERAAATGCPWCGALVGVVAWAWSHAPSCPAHQTERNPA